VYEGGGTRTHDLGIKRSSTDRNSKPRKAASECSIKTSLQGCWSGVVHCGLLFSYSLGTVTAA